MEDGSVSTGGNTQRFTSYDRSTATGKDYAVNRYYDPQQGRLMLVDPLGMRAANLAHPHSLNMYAYVRKDPVNAVDPTGLAEPIRCYRESDGWVVCVDSSGNSTRITVTTICSPNLLKCALCHA